MTLQKLICFVQVADCLNFSEAARALHMAQPSLSRQIVSLEEELDLRLFERNTRKVALTPAGKALAQEAREVIRRADSLHHLAGRLREGYAGKVAVGYSGAIDESIVAPLLRGIADFRPRLEVELHRMNQGRLIAGLQRGEVDAALLFRGGLVEQGQLKTVTLARSELCLAVAKNHPLAGRETVEIEELKGLPLSFMERGESAVAHDRFLALCHRHGVVANITRSNDDFQTNLLSAVAGEEGAILPVVSETTLPGGERRMPYGLEVIPLVSNGARIREDVVLAYDEEGQSEAGAAFLNWVRRSVGRLRES